MEIPLLSEESGTVTKLHVAEGDVVQEDDLIAEIGWTQTPVVVRG